ncbi:uncharacterized protein I303_101101 [Kwoniella dejecticola CBS 10117]|uniref:Uncharacterized protein n=1 Tax=Kwoniella dejecticola CBS 10117 TaxID=1296121 RepID=A0A1A6AGS7_9TREE|nr:uncharacterized protein I303_01105 [Kwoniella dejecticola CBS 10117]OBR89280.1 hypothetical protein I303_01105 [Kwoniella dejecticola CBS 10117]
MPICVINISDQIETRQVEIVPEEQYTAKALCRIIYWLFDCGVQYISVSATETDAVVIVDWANEEWSTMCDVHSVGDEHARGRKDPTEPAKTAADDSEKPNAGATLTVNKDIFDIDEDATEEQVCMLP